MNIEPLRIDAVIIKKAQEAVIDTPLGAIFRGHNIIEYKSPEDYLSIADYHKVEAYTHLYCALERVEITDMTITLVSSGYPRKLMKYLREVYGYKIHESAPGIYRVEGGSWGCRWWRRGTWGRGMAGYG
jgi:hypothetical protein